MSLVKNLDHLSMLRLHLYEIWLFIVVLLSHNQKISFSIT